MKRILIFLFIFLLTVSNSIAGGPIYCWDDGSGQKSCIRIDPTTKKLLYCPYNESCVDFGSTSSIVQIVDIEDTGEDIIRATANLTPTSGFKEVNVIVNCNDDDGCLLSMVEDGNEQDNYVAYIISTGSNVVTMEDDEQTLKVPDGTMDLEPGYMATLRYVSTRWITQSAPLNLLYIEAINLKNGPIQGGRNIIPSSESITLTDLQMDSTIVMSTDNTVVSIPENFCDTTGYKFCVRKVSATGTNVFINSYDPADVFYLENFTALDIGDSVEIGNTAGSFVCFTCEEVNKWYVSRVVGDTPTDGGVTSTLWDDPNCLGAWGLNNVYTDSSGSGTPHTLTAFGSPSFGSSSPLPQEGTHYITLVSGSNQYLSQDSSDFDGTGSFTNGCWIYFTAEEQSEIASKGASGNGQWRVRRNDSEDSFQFAITPDGSSYYYKTTAINEAPINQWIHIAWVFDADQEIMRFYIDGVEHTDRSFPATYALGMNSSTDALLWGRYDTNYCSGNIDHAFAYNRVLSSSEILWIKENTEP